MTSITQQNCQIIEPLTEKTLGQVWGTFYSFHEEEKGELLSKNMARRQLDGQHMLLGEYLQT